MVKKAEKNPYATKAGEPKDGQFAEWFGWEQQRDAQRRVDLTDEQRQAEDEPRRQLTDRMRSESELLQFDEGNVA